MALCEFRDMTLDEQEAEPTGFTRDRRELAERGLTQRSFATVSRQAIDTSHANHEHPAINAALVQRHES
jgi:hypothetical protein